MESMNSRVTMIEAPPTYHVAPMTENSIQNSSQVKLLWAWDRDGKGSLQGRFCRGRFCYMANLLRQQFILILLRKLLLEIDQIWRCGVDLRATDKVLLQSSKPSLHTNVDCTALVAVVVSRDDSIVRLLLQADVGTNVEVRLGAWSWDTTMGEEFRVDTGMAKPYAIIWCIVEWTMLYSVTMLGLLDISGL